MTHAGPSGQAALTLPPPRRYSQTTRNVAISTMMKGPSNSISTTAVPSPSARLGPQQTTREPLGEALA